MSDIIVVLIEYFRHYHIWILGLVIILQNNGIPMGSNLLVMAAGAFAFAGEFSMSSLLGQVLLFSVLGDSLSYCLWRKAGGTLLFKLPRVEKHLTPSLKKAEKHFNQYGRATVLLTRFPLSALNPVINISAGLSGYRYLFFVVTAAVGELVWGGFNLGLGYWFGDEWEQIADLANQFGQLLLMVTALAVIIYVLVRVKKSRWNKNAGTTENKEAI